MKLIVLPSLISLALVLVAATILDAISQHQLDQTYENSKSLICRNEFGHIKKCPCPSSRHYVKNLLQCTEVRSIVEP